MGKSVTIASNGPRAASRSQSRSNTRPSSPTLDGNGKFKTPAMTIVIKLGA